MPIRLIHDRWIDKYTERRGVDALSVNGTDEFGNDVYTTTEEPYAAEVRPLGSAETVGDRTQVQTRYRVFLAASAVVLSPADAVQWRGITLELEGDLERHALGPNLHHVEVIAARVSG